MQLKFVKSIDSIHRHFNEIARELENGKRGADLLDTWNIDVNDSEQIKQILVEREALRYMAGLTNMMVRDQDAIKPEIEDLESAFNRHLAFLGDIFNCHAANWRSEPDANIRKEYEACRHYLFKLSLPAFVESLPERVQTFENKYPKFDENELPIPIPKN